MVLYLDIQHLLALNLIWKHINSESLIDTIMLNNCDNNQCKFGQFR